MEIDKQALYLLAVAALEGAKKYQQQEKPKETQTREKNLPCPKNKA